jgi:hypothetical protein
MITRNNITEVAYNIQTTVDDKHMLPIDYKVTNTNDSKAMGGMLGRAKTILKSNDFTALYDKGYHTGSEFETADNLGIDVMVAIPKVAANAPNPNYNVENFSYSNTEDCYTCPQGKTLTTNGKWHKAKTYNFKRYTTKACKTCAAKPECSKAICGKAIQRSEFQELVDRNKQHISENKELYRKRQQIVEHPYGTIKRQWGFSYILTKKGINRASADVGFIMTAYNLRKIINIIGLKELKKHLKTVIFFNLEKMMLVKSKLSKIRIPVFQRKNRKPFPNFSLKQLYLIPKLTLQNGF